MACSCGGGRKSARAADRFVYEVVFPGSDTPVEYLTPLEAKRAIRKAGGGTLTHRRMGPRANVA